MGANCTNLNVDAFVDGNNLGTLGSSNELRQVDTGTRQSPIDIDTSRVLIVNPQEQSWKMLRIIYPSLMSNLVIQNTGYGWKLDLPDMVAAKTELIGGPLGGHIYRMLQFHCHWGPNINVGSEHTVNKRSYAAELHFVHWNTSIYMDPLQAMSNPNGLAVVAVFIDIGYQLNEELEKVLKQIDSVQYKGDRKLMLEAIDIGKLMPRNKSYWTYQGSLTTPPLFESVTWIIYSTPIFVTIEQIEKFRQILYTNQMDSEMLLGGKLIENYRRTQPLNNRIVRFVRDRSRELDNNNNQQQQQIQPQRIRQPQQQQQQQQQQPLRRYPVLNNRMMTTNYNNHQQQQRSRRR